MTMTLETFCEAIGVRTLPIGVYDAPTPEDFAPLIPLKRCVFDHYEDFQAGLSLVIDATTQGCRGCGYWMTGKGRFPSKKAMVDFLADKEGLRASAEVVENWLELHPTFAPANGHVVLGPVREHLAQFLRTVTFFVAPDQLSALIYGANYHARVGDADPVLAPFGSGCGNLYSMFPDLSEARGIIGATDIAMRQHVPRDLLAFTVTVPMLERLLNLDDGHSFLDKPWLKRLIGGRQP